VLVRGGVKDDPRPVQREDLAEPPLVPDIPGDEFKPPPEIRVEPRQLQPLVVQLRLVVLKQDDPLRGERADLVDDLRADRPPRPR